VKFNSGAQQGAADSIVVVSLSQFKEVTQILEILPIYWHLVLCISLQTTHARSGERFSAPLAYRPIVQKMGLPPMY
jgi:hypothetical protein